MESQISADEFRRVLDDARRDKPVSEKKNLLSYRFPLTETDFKRIILPLFFTSEKSFYFEKPVSGNILCAAGMVHSVKSSGEHRFEVIENASNNVNLKVFQSGKRKISRNVPLWLGSMSFFADHKDSLWQEFSPSDWFIPEFIILKSDNDYWASFQVNLDVTDDFGSRFENLKKYLFETRGQNGRFIALEQDYRREPDDREKDKWIRNVGKTIDSIRGGGVDKVVLSRCVRFHGISGDRLVCALMKQGISESVCKGDSPTYGTEAEKQNGYNFMFRSGESLFLGISPEKLANFSDGVVYCDAIAGSIGRGKTKEEDDLLGNDLLQSFKNRSEHEFVVTHIESVLNRYCTDVSVERLPVLKKISYIQHLSTGASGKIRSDISMFSILKSLHPTPAVGGYPVNIALKMIRDFESYDRGLYTGFIGWFDGEGNGEFAVSLRSALLINDTLHAFAGGGIVGDSRPDEEFEETEIKLHAIISLLST